MKNEENESNATVNQKQAPGVVIDDIWSTFPNVHLRVLAAEKGSVEIQICDCGMSGQCRPQGWARIEKHNRERLAKSVAVAAPTPSEAALKAAREIAAELNGSTRDDCSRPEVFVRMFDDPSITNEAAFANWIAEIIQRHVTGVGEKK